MAHKMTIDCDGPFGAVERSEYVIDFADLRESVARHNGTLHETAKAVTKLADKLPRATQPIRMRLEPNEENEPCKPRAVASG
jgi:hypothetical protein